MFLFPKALVFPLCFLPLGLLAQQVLTLQLPDVQIFADQLLKGDADTYGLGDWACTFTVALDGYQLKLEGKITFTEKANDFTTIVGKFHQNILARELQLYRNAVFSLEQSKGSVRGPNIGARGYQWFEGQGMVRRAFIQTDTFGSDTGNIGGIVQFAPIRLIVKHLRV